MPSSTHARPWLPAVLVVAAGLAAVSPRSPRAVESLYAGAFYPPWQRAVTTVSNLMPVSLFDAVVGVALGLLVWRWGRAVGAWRRRGGLAPWRGALAFTAGLLSVAYLWFLVAWGLNYSRLPLDRRLGLPSGEPAAEDVRALLDEAVREVNARYATAPAGGQVGNDVPQDLVQALHGMERHLRRSVATVAGRPKPTLLATYFRMAGVDGLTAPFTLETLLNAELTAAERPFTLAHEWAHLSGEASESDANFLAWLVTQAPEASAHTRYSGWLFVVAEAARQVSARERQDALQRLADGPRADLEAIRARASRRVDLVERVGWRVYDRYLQSQGVDDGIRSYSTVIALIVRDRRRPAAARAGRTP